MIRQFNFLLVALLVLSFAKAQDNAVVYRSGRFTVYRDSVVQGKFTAKAISDRKIVSDYKSPANEFKSAEITFKFSINGKDNEMKPGVDHHFVVRTVNGISETPVLKFGKQSNSAESTGTYLSPNTSLKIRVDMRDVLNEFSTKGYYTTFNGDKIYKSDFKGVYIAGNTAPLIWDFDNLVNHPDLQLHDEDGDGIYEVTLRLNQTGETATTASVWTLSKDISAFPVYHSGYPISDALYNLAMEEMVNAVEPDSTFRTGKEWAGVWTRDISYSIILSMAHLQPAVAKYSLLKKVNKKRKIIQDTGTGGAWPVSTDRMIWATAAWELYKVTGDRDWLEEAYIIIKHSIDDDVVTDYDHLTGLVKGESSFLDWREQTYPKWMQPVDIAGSECLGTNAVHYQANMVLSQMAAALGHKAEAARYLGLANGIKNGINKYLWQPDKKYYGQYLYGRNSKLLSPRAEALGEALCVVFGIADPERQKQIVAHTPVTEFGISCIYPQIPDIPPYHNNAVWPFVQTYWLWAAVRAGNEKSAMESIASIYRPAALFVTNKENFVAENGDFLGTQINSSNMLWSLSGNISIVHKVLFGIRFKNGSLGFEPFVPRSLEGKRTLSNFRYRSAVLNIEMEGYGDKVKLFTVDGKPLARVELPSTLRGTHVIKMILGNKEWPPQTINKVKNSTSPATPETSLDAGLLKWAPVKGAIKYIIIENGKPVTTTQALSYAVDSSIYSECQVIAVDNKGYESFASEPKVTAPRSFVNIYEVEQFVGKADYPYSGYSGTGFAEISLAVNRTLTLPIMVTADGTYALDFRYANGNGPTNTENKCAIRSLKVDGRRIGTSLFPQRGKEEWSNWGYSNPLHVHLTRGKHEITLYYEDSDENMNEKVNQAMLDALRITRTGK